MQTIPGGVNSWYVDSVVVSKKFALLYIYFLHGSAYVLALFCILIPTFLG
jgi:hypothetical protein